LPSRDYVVISIMPSYFVRTAAKAGISAGPIKAIFDDLRAQVPAAVDQAVASSKGGSCEGQ